MRRFGLIDLASAVSLRMSVTRLPEPVALPLLDSKRFADLLPVGPWIVDLELAPSVYSNWRTSGLYRSWGVFLESDYDISALRSHFRKFNLVALDGSSRPVFFRYYDPRALRQFFRVATDEQYSAFMTPILRVICPDPESQSLKSFRSVPAYNRSKMGRVDASRPAPVGGC